MRVNPGLGAKENLLVAPIPAAVLLLDSQKLASLSDCPVENDRELAPHLSVVKYRYRLYRLEGLVSLECILPQTEYLLTRARPTRLSANCEQSLAVPFDSDPKRKPQIRCALNNPYG